MTTGESDGAFVPSLDTRPFGTPLRRFDGVLQEYVPTKHAAQEGGREYMTIVFNFVDVVVIESVEPYAFPIATISVPYNTTTETRWDALASSIKKVFGHTPSLEELVGKKQQWAFLSAKLRKKEGDDWITANEEAWQLVSIEGVGSGVSGSGTTPSSDIDAHILTLLDGKTEQDFLQAFYQDPEVRKFPDLITAATNRELLPSLEKAGRIGRDPQGIWHKSEASTSTT